MNDIIKVGETINSKENMTSLEIAEVTGKERDYIINLFSKEVMFS